MNILCDHLEKIEQEFRRRVTSSAKEQLYFNELFLDDRQFSGFPHIQRGKREEKYILETLHGGYKSDRKAEYNFS